MRIKILGIGGAINNGLPYNAFMLGRTVLVEAPPDIMISLQKFSVDIHAIDTIYISHFHADHYFGLPFLLLTLFVDVRASGKEKHLTIIGPENIADRTLSLLETAFSSEHPCLQWAKENIQFTGINESSVLEILPGCRTTFYKMNHFVETYGFALEKDSQYLFAYTADTLWCSALEKMLSFRPATVLIDGNGQKSDVVPIHLSSEHIAEQAVPLTKNETQFYITHVFNRITETAENIQYAEEGMEISITSRLKEVSRA